MNKYSHRERIETCLSGCKPDFTPVALWRHFPVDDQNAFELARSTIEYQHTYDFDLVKVTPASSFCIRDWGVKDTWRGNPEGTREYSEPIIKAPEDWLSLTPLNPLQGSLQQQLTCLHLLRKEFDRQTPLLQTIFSPLSQAKNLAGKTRLLEHIRTHPELVASGLEIITKSTLDFIEECKKMEIDGIFYAIQFAQRDLLTESEILHFEKQYAFRILEIVKDLWLNFAHLHGENVSFDAMCDLPVQVLNWHDRHTPPSLQQAKAKFPGMVCGGLRQIETLSLGNAQNVTGEAFDAIEQTDGIRFILGTGCVTPIITPSGNIRAAVQAARGGI